QQDGPEVREDGRFVGHRAVSRFERSRGRGQIVTQDGEGRQALQERGGGFVMPSSEATGVVDRGAVLAEDGAHPRVRAARLASVGDVLEVGLEEGSRFACERHQARRRTGNLLGIIGEARRQRECRSAVFGCPARSPDEEASCLRGPAGGFRSLGLRKPALDELGGRSSTHLCAGARGDEESEQPEPRHHAGNVHRALALGPTLDRDACASTTRPSAVFVRARRCFRVMRPTRLRGARTNNLRGIDLDIEPGSLVAVAGVSGAGKSSLAFGTLYAEGQRRYVESFSAYARQFLERLARPPVDGLDPVAAPVAVDRQAPVRTSRSTVGTMTEIADYAKRLWARAASLHCPGCGRPVVREEPEAIAEELLREAGAR